MSSVVARSAGDVGIGAIAAGLVLFIVFESLLDDLITIVRK